MVIRAMVSSSSSLSTGNPLLTQPTEKLTKMNHSVWYAQVRAVIRGARLMGHLTGESKPPPSQVPQEGANGAQVKDDSGKVLMTPNPEFEDWEAMDQQVLSYLLGSLSKEILIHVSTCDTAAPAWAAIQGIFVSRMRARTVNTRLALGTTRKGNLSTMDYFNKMKALDDEMAVAGRPLDDEELIEYIITGLYEEFTPLVSAICARAEPISLSEFYSQLLSFETHVGLLQDGQSRSINTSTRGGFRGRGNMRARGTGTGGHDFSTGRGGGRGGYGYHNAQKYSNNNELVICQVCGKKNHAATECWHRFNESYIPEQKIIAHAATGSYNIDPNWYANSGATDHITGELEKIAIRNKYQGGDQIHMASGAGMDISHIGHNTVYTPHCPIYLNNILYVPRTRKKSCLCSSPYI
jgi:hypothetical protein